FDYAVRRAGDAEYLLCSARRALQARPQKQRSGAEVLVVHCCGDGDAVVWLVFHIWVDAFDELRGDTHEDGVAGRNAVVADYFHVSPVAERGWIQTVHGAVSHVDS